MQFLTNIISPGFSNFEIYFWNIFKTQLLPESTNKAKYRRDCTEEKVLGWDVIVSAFKSHIIQTLQTFYVLLYCYVMDKSGKILLLHLLIRTSHKLLTLLKISPGFTVYCTSRWMTSRVLCKKTTKNFWFAATKWLMLRPLLDCQNFKQTL